MKVSKRKSKRKKGGHNKVSTGYSLTKTTCDNGCGSHKDKRTKRLRTRADKQRFALADQY